MIDKDLLKKYSMGPGLCTLAEVVEVDGFLKDYIKYRDMYKSVFGVDPTGLTLESNRDSAKWYKEFHKNGGHNG